MKPADAMDTIRTIIRARLPDPSYRVFVFGSRVTGTARKFSDVDVGILGNKTLPGHVVECIKEDLENSNIPYIVDVVDFTTAAPSFRNLAMKNIRYL
ncbi:nucleotidyltransferase domain-containing protein [Candidatus Gottesmanbacteria bacterium]|nr:nucleotidyltransferase domain-containing protein [Candidatus Gottesmanbacteria bacterium]